MYNENLDSDNSQCKNTANFRIKRDNIGYMQSDSMSGANTRQSVKTKLNKTSKLIRKHGTGFNSNKTDMGMNNYTVSINFNRPQQSKGKRPSKKSIKQNNASKKNNGWMKNGVSLNFTFHMLTSKFIHNLIDYFRRAFIKRVNSLKIFMIMILKRIKQAILILNQAPVKEHLRLLLENKRIGVSLYYSHIINYSHQMFNSLKSIAKFILHIKEVPMIHKTYLSQHL